MSLNESEVESCSLSERDEEVTGGQSNVVVLGVCTGRFKASKSSLRVCIILPCLASATIFLKATGSFS